MTETPAGDALLPDSHVIFAAPKGQSSIFGGVLGIVGGGIGGLIGSAIDNARAQSAAKEGAGDSINQLKIKWFNEMNAALKLVGEKNPKFRVEMGTVEDPGIKVRVYARMTPAKPEGHYSASLVARTRQRDPVTEKESNRNYFYFGVEARPIAGDGGWASIGDSSLRAATAIGVDRLAEAIAKDANGAYKDQYASENLKKVTWKFKDLDQPISIFVIEETDATIIAFPVNRDKASKFAVLVYEKSWIEKRVGAN